MEFQKQTAKPSKEARGRGGAVAAGPMGPSWGPMGPTGEIVTIAPWDILPIPLPVLSLQGSP